MPTPTIVAVNRGCAKSNLNMRIMQILKLNQHAYSYISKFVVHSQSELIMYRIPATQRRLRYRCLIMKLFMARPPAVAGRCKRGSRPSTYVHACQINARVYMPRHIMPLPDLSFVFLFACAVVIRGNCLYSFRTSHCWRKKKIHPVRLITGDNFRIGASGMHRQGRHHLAQLAHS